MSPTGKTIEASVEFPIEDGDAIILTCNTDIEDPDSYEWFKGGGKMPNENQETINIGNTKATASGEYKCSVNKGNDSSAKSRGKIISFNGE